jgi:hypothetical protein
MSLFIFNWRFGQALFLHVTSELFEIFLQLLILGLIILVLYFVSSFIFVDWRSRVYRLKHIIVVSFLRYSIFFSCISCVVWTSTALRFFALLFMLIVRLSQFAAFRIKFSLTYRFKWWFVFIIYVYKRIFNLLDPRSALSWKKSKGLENCLFSFTVLFHFTLIGFAVREKIWLKVLVHFQIQNLN